MYVRKVLLLAAYLLAALLALASASDFYPSKRSGDDRPFIMPSRYGRSRTVMKDRRVVVAPRNDNKLYFGRYGKRSSASGEEDDSSRMMSAEDLSCHYTGIADLYRCSGSKGSEESASK